MAVDLLETTEQIERKWHHKEMSVELAITDPRNASQFI